MTFKKDDPVLTTDLHALHALALVQVKKNGATDEQLAVMAVKPEDPVYMHTPDMGEISGFGGGYELTCQNMLHEGVKWVISQKLSPSDIKVHGYSGVYGLVIPDNDVAKFLDQVIGTASGGDCTGAMMHAVFARVMKIAEKGWDWYCAELRKPRLEEGEEVHV